MNIKNYNLCFPHHAKEILIKGSENNIEQIRIFNDLTKRQIKLAKHFAVLEDWVY